MKTASTQASNRVPFASLRAWGQRALLPVVFGLALAGLSLATTGCSETRQGIRNAVPQPLSPQSDKTVAREASSPSDTGESVWWSTP